MVSDSENYYFDYKSSQNSSSIDYQIDLFEFRQHIKSNKTKRQIKKPSCSVPKKTLKSFPTLVKVKCVNDKQTLKAEQKPFRYNRYPSKAKPFDCDVQFQDIPKETTEISPAAHNAMLAYQLKEQKRSQHKSRLCFQWNAQVNHPKVLEAEHLTSFSSFRHYFYCANHQAIKSSFERQRDIEIIDIRLASVNERVQNQFMETLNKTLYFPYLAYYGTKLSNIESILRDGFLMPDQLHLSNPEVPTITLQNGHFYGSGIYCSRWAGYSALYMNDTNTLLACAVLPKRDQRGKIERCYGDILVLQDASRIVPLFLLDLKFLTGTRRNYPRFNDEEELTAVEKKRVKKPTVIPRKYLRKVLASMNDQARKHDQYQERSFE
ncbi:unnamed protein product [Didymodactylos carnosus]|uniref:PARP catalytic domain-containing protein n=1 Tax=Didymodactylos carnosus TaxID=1234261 RepID=A0A814R2Q7_9BILA|nr:unnamed protein product [Didymodactylos carnosus]CAF1127758.1 unnamed protein product [Didymodactylos carnosus]CAF3742190.1 unnamed protein product [Didymodactylos carnosus]CAF3891272.1 unnamed protein product [Didymodactylos carnosus]